MLRSRGYVRVDEPADADVVTHAAGTVGPWSGAVVAGAGVVLLVVSAPSTGTNTHGTACQWVTGAGIVLTEIPTAQTAVVGASAEFADSPSGLHPAYLGPSGAPIAQHLLARVDVERLVPTATLKLEGTREAIRRLPGAAGSPGTPVAATGVLGTSRIVVLGVDIAAGSGDLL